MLKIHFLGLALFGIISACSQTERTEATLPENEVRGAESSSYNLHYKNHGEAVTALGQIFIPPEGHTYLFSVGFLCRGDSSSTSDMNVKLRLSSWEGDRPSSDTLWESEPTLLEKDFVTGWVSFDVPRIKLIPNQKYIAWLSMSGLENADDAGFSVVLMGPRTKGPLPENTKTRQPNHWIVAYPKGMRAFWDQYNPDGLIDDMTQSAWKTDSGGHNLHFKMMFENKQQ